MPSPEPPEPSTFAPAEHRPADFPADLPWIPGYEVVLTRPTGAGVRSCAWLPPDESGEAEREIRERVRGSVAAIPPETVESLTSPPIARSAPGAPRDRAAAEALTADLTARMHALSPEARDGLHSAFRQLFAPPPGAPAHQAALDALVAACVADGWHVVPDAPEAPAPVRAAGLRSATLDRGDRRRLFTVSPLAPGVVMFEGARPVGGGAASPVWSG